MKFPLNDPQRAAVRYIDGPLLVLAGAGSGKTRGITAKIAHLLDQGADPAGLAALTVTNKPARRNAAMAAAPRRRYARFTRWDSRSCAARRRRCS